MRRSTLGVFILDRPGTMGFALTILYLVTTYLGTDTVFGPLAEFHVELIFALLLIVISVPSLPRSFLPKTPQAFALIGLAAAVFLSVLATGWMGGAVKAFQNFIPNAFAYYLVCLHCRSRRKLQILVLLLVGVCSFVIARGASELVAAPKDSPDSPHEQGSVSPYLLGQQNDEGRWFYRIRGQNLINDPNDFAQLIASAAPLVFVFWQPKRMIRNTLFVVLPVCGLVCGAFLTHSRGVLLAFLAMAIIAGRRRFGIIPSVVGAGVLFVAASMFNFAGGRGVSVDAGSDRMVLWASALGLVKSHPLFGVGFGNLPDYIGLTAHNSIVLCVAELGLVGLYFWSLFLFPTLRDARALASIEHAGDRAPTPSRNDLVTPAKVKRQGFEGPEAKRFGELLILSFTGFLTTGFFLSRAFVLTFFLLGGIAEVVFEMALQREMVRPRWRVDRVLFYSGVLSISMVLFVYILLHVSSFH